MFVVIAILTHHHCKCQQLILSQQFLNFTNIYISILKYFLCNVSLQKLSIFQSFCISVHKLYVQITESMTSEDVRKRELTPLQKRNQRFSLVPQNYRIFFMNRNFTLPDSYSPASQPGRLTCTNASLIQSCVQKPL